MKKKPSIIAITIILLIAAAAITAALLFRKEYGKEPNDDITPELTDEFARAKDFIADWYTELRTQGKCSVYLNELQFSNGKYTLTFANGRVRAVYPRGERFFKLEYITKIEFFETNGALRCRFFYGQSGEYMVRIN